MASGIRATPFNSFFFLYVALGSLAIWSLVALLPRIEVERLAGAFEPRTPTRAVAAYLVINVALFLALWLRATVPAVLSSEPPVFLEGTGMTTGPVQILDLGFTLPLMTVAAILLWRRRPWGFVLTGGLLVMLAIETLSIAVDQWLGYAADASSPAASAEIVPVMLVLTAIGLVALGAYSGACEASGPRTTGEPDSRTAARYQSRSLMGRSKGPRTTATSARSWTTARRSSCSPCDPADTGLAQGQGG